MPYKGSEEGRIKCSVNDCSRTFHARGLCKAHYWRWYRGVSLEPPINHRRNNPTDDKRCAACGLIKPVSEYYKVTRYSGSQTSRCKLCLARYRDENRPYLRDMVNRSQHKLRAETLKVYGGQCACCGEARIEFLVLDHINGGGNAHRREVGRYGGANFYRILRQQGWPLGFRVLCWNCNFAIGHYGYCPHGNSIYVTSALP